MLYRGSADQTCEASDVVVIMLETTGKTQTSKWQKSVKVASLQILNEVS